VFQVRKFSGENKVAGFFYVSLTIQLALDAIIFLGAAATNINFSKEADNALGRRFAEYLFQLINS